MESKIEERKNEYQHLIGKISETYSNGNSKVVLA
jgi:hypothetical protein